MTAAILVAFSLSLTTGAGANQSFTVSERAFKQLQSAQEALAEKKLPRARDILERLGQWRSLSEHEHCLRLQTLAVVYVEQKDYHKATEALQGILRRGALPHDALLAMRFNLAQLLLALDRVEDAVQAFRRWDADAPTPSADALYTIAVAHARLERFKAALSYVERALATTPSPPESWLQLKLACLVKASRFKEALPVMRALIGLRPSDPSRWRQLSALYSQAGQDGAAVAALELAHARGLLKRPSDLRILAENLAALGVPAKAARIIGASLGAGQLSPDVDTLMLQARCLLAARERSQARSPLKAASKLARNGRPDLELARLEVGAKNWRAALRAAARALEKGDLPQPGQAHLFMGIARHRLGRLVEARRAFSAAAKYPSQARAAGGWLRFLGDGA